MRLLLEVSLACLDVGLGFKDDGDDDFQLSGVCTFRVRLMRLLLEVSLACLDMGLGFKDGDDDDFQLSVVCTFRAGVERELCCDCGESVRGADITCHDAETALEVLGFSWTWQWRRCSGAGGSHFAA
jgi:hypothetical protein